MITVVTIDGVNLDVDDRIAAQMHLDGLAVSLNGYDQFAFHIEGGAPSPVWFHGDSVEVTIDFELPSPDDVGPELVFKGEITDRSWQPGGPHGWKLGYTCQGLRYQSDRVPITAPDLTGNYVLNRQPDDPYGTEADRGLSIGEMFERVLTIQSVADALDAVGIQYASLSPPTLHADTAADLALLTVVPPQPVHLGGDAIFNTLEQVLGRWMPTFLLVVPPSGILRCLDTQDISDDIGDDPHFLNRLLYLPGIDGVGDPGVGWPAIRSTTAHCATRVVLRGGPRTAAALLSTADGTLAEDWDPADEPSWTLYDYTSPGDAKDEGTVISMTGNSAEVLSTNALVTWAADFWSDRQAQIFLIDTSVTGINAYINRRVTTCDAHTAGSTTTITWDASQPAPSSSFNKYRLVGGAGGNADISRLYTVREPDSGDTGLDTYIGSHLVVRSPTPIKWANNSKAIDVFYAAAVVVGGTVATEVPVGVEVLPGSGQFRLVVPAVLTHGNPADLNLAYPTDVAGGLPIDVQIFALYATGVNSVAVPPDIMGVPQYEGSAYDDEGLEATLTIDVPSFRGEWDEASMTALGQAHLDSRKDTEYTGTGELMAPPTWNVLKLGYSLSYAIDGADSPWDMMQAPVQSCSVSWTNGQGPIHRTTWEFSTRRRPFSGDDMYLHPCTSGGDVLGGGGGGIGYADYAAMGLGGAFESHGDDGLDAFRGQVSGGLDQMRRGGGDGNEWGFNPLRDGPIGRPATEREKAQRAEGAANADRREGDRKDVAQANRAERQAADRARFQAEQDKKERERKAREDFASPHREFLESFDTGAPGIPND